MGSGGPLAICVLRSAETPAFRRLSTCTLSETPAFLRLSGVSTRGNPHSALLREDFNRDNILNEG